MSGPADTVTLNETNGPTRRKFLIKHLVHNTASPAFKVIQVYAATGRDIAFEHFFLTWN